MTTEATDRLLTHSVLAFLTAEPPRHATIATLNADGSPHQTLIWFDVRGDDIVVNSRVGRRWPANLRRDPRATLAVYERADGVALDCEVVGTREGEQALADISAMASRYTDEADAQELIDEWRRQERITFVLRPTRVHVAGDPQ